ncbi:gamma-glutamyltransferase [Thiolapillus brandeum]|nr:gamma-glutamyltransferase [Thiolapillus brandeum]
MAVASAHPAATRAGLEILQAGGNAFDAAVAVSAALAVVEPYSSGLGGGGFWLLHRASDAHEVMIDGRERAPLAAHRDMYLDSQGRPVAGASIDGPLAAGIPGEPAALAYLAEHYGRLPLRQSLQPAIRLAAEGFKVNEHYRRMAAFRLGVLQASPAAARQFLLKNRVPPVGHIIRQPDLAQTLGALARHGKDGFYGGEIARRMVKAVRRHGGIWTLADLRQYEVRERQPVSGSYRGWRVVSAAPPSSGGVVLLEMLNMLSGKDLKGLDDADRVHYLVEVMRRAYADRARWLGDADYVQMPLKRLLSPEYARQLANGIDMNKATSSSSLASVRAEGHDTTHFSILDQEGNRVAATLSINYPFGSGFVAEGTGVLLNDEMDDFSIKPGVANVYGLVGAEANAIAPGKRMLSSMSPTFLESPDQVAVLGTPGGSRIITMVLLGLLEAVDGKDVHAWVSRPRFHHQYLPDVIQVEPGAFDENLKKALEAKGHKLDQKDRPWGNMQAIHWNRGRNRVEAASDPRGSGAALVQPR